MMGFLAPLLRSLIAGNVKSTVERTRNQAVCWAIIGGALGLAVVFICLIAFLWLSDLMRPLYAASLIALFWIVVALIAFCVNQCLAARKRRDYEKQLAEQKANLLMATALAALPALSKKNLLVAALPVLGLAALLFLNGKDNPKQDDDTTEQ